MKEPLDKYIKRFTPCVSLQVRIESKIKREAEKAAKKMDTSLNRFAEAALVWYLDALKKDGLL